MSLTMAIVMMIGAWLLVAAAMLWGVMRIARRHHHPAPSAAQRQPLDKPDNRPASSPSA
ncbi:MULTISPECIES: hypothetical protein [Pseudomonas]|uniref:Uncharacterized protein n=1 Tax=Pseudomonas eucalypticola TaxID=2599595 RepID=A0A7D5HIA0_9PSED|nr:MULTISPECIES: hypothetical protein [Pseudomonas]QKZ05906.1 hypothetical protein HWQ56_19800 [Pseudomonas eucalypticola]